MNENLDLYRLINEKFKFMRFLDTARWKDDVNNYYTINMADKNVSGEQLLLTHFLGYITNRQTPFKRVFEQLDYIFSQLVQDYMGYRLSVEDLLAPDGDKSYFLKRKETKKKKSESEDEEEKTSYSFASKPGSDPEQSAMKEITKKLLEGKERFYAVSRNYSTDYVAIRLTLDILDEKYHRSLFEFMKKVIQDDWNNGLERLLYALWVLGYMDVGRWSVKDIQDGSFVKGTESEYSKILDNKKKALQLLETSKDIKVIAENPCLACFESRCKESERFNAKRVTCFLRDLLMYHPCVDKFCEDDVFKSHLEMLKTQMPEVLELPGDTWNNNSVFHQCLALKYENKRDGDKPNYAVRCTYEELIEKLGEDEVGCYPEQFDCTFNFVQRMCDSVAMKNCDYCPISRRRMEDNGNLCSIPVELCLQTKPDGDPSIEDKYCPFLLLAAGYKAKCKDVKHVCPKWIQEHTKQP